MTSVRKEKYGKINRDKVLGFTWDNKEYFKHTGYPGGQYIQTPNQLLEKDATRIIKGAVKGMVPKNKL